MRQFVLTRAAYGPGWSLDANRRRLDFARGTSIASLRSQSLRDFRWLVLLHRRDALLEERRAAFGEAGAEFLYMDDLGTPGGVAYLGYRAGWADAIGERDGYVAMTRLDDDDALAPWAMERIRARAEKAVRRSILMLPTGIRVWCGRFTVVRHDTNAMQTLVTPPGDAMTVYDYGHRFARRVAPVTVIDRRIAWLWSRHEDTISGWKVADHPLTDEFRAMFPVDWSLFGASAPQRWAKAGSAGRTFR